MEQELRILILEDVAADAELVECELRRAKMAFSSKRVETKETFLKELTDFAPDIILSDYSLPQFDGTRALLLVKELAPSIPFIIVTGRINEETAVECMKAGAADYVLKDRLLRLGPAVKSALEKKRSIEEKEKAEEKLRQSEAHSRALIENASDIITILDAYGTIRYESPSVERVLGYRPESLIGKNIIDYVHPDDAPSVTNAFTRRILNARVALSIEFRFRHKDGSWRTLEAIGNNLLKDPAVAGVVVNSRDITARKLAEDALRKVQGELEIKVKELEEKNKETEDFIYAISHDLKSPLISMQGFLTELRSVLKGKLGEEDDFYLSRIEANAHQLESLIYDLLALSKVGRINMDLALINFNEVLGEALKPLDYQTRAKGIELQIQSGFPHVLANPRGLEQVLTNLISNAIDYMGDQTQPRIEIGFRAEEHRWVFYVKDNGIGIAPEYQQRIFHIFERLPEAQNLNPHGTGAGLAIVTRIINSLGGKVWVESQAGEGATFYFTLAKVSEMLQVQK